MNPININTSSIATTVAPQKRAGSIGTEYRPKIDGAKTRPVGATKSAPNNVPSIKKSIRRRKPFIVRAIRAFIKFTAPISDDTAKPQIKAKSVSTTAPKFIPTTQSVAIKKSKIKFKENAANNTLFFFLKLAILSCVLYLVSSVLLRSIEVDYSVKMQETEEQLSALDGSIVALNTQLSELKSLNRLSEYAKQFGLEISYDRIRFVEESPNQNAH